LTQKIKSFTARLLKVHRLPSSACEISQLILLAGGAGSSSHDAIKDGLLKRGDVLISIDGIDIRDHPMEDIAARLLGPEGSLVMVKFRRKTNVGFMDNVIVMDRKPTKLEDIKRVSLSLIR
jgi:hypothetical protein